MLMCHLSLRVCIRLPHRQQPLFELRLDVVVESTHFLRQKAHDAILAATTTSSHRLEAGDDPRQLTIRSWVVLRPVYIRYGGKRSDGASDVGGRSLPFWIVIHEGDVP